MYGLSTPTSDCDYHLCYLASPAELLSLRDSISLRKLHFSRHVGAHYGAAKDGVLEYSAVELSHYLTTLTKGNPSALELLFVPDGEAIALAWPWDELVAMRDRFVTEVAFAQYIGFITVHIKRAESYLRPASEAASPPVGGDGASSTVPPPLTREAASAVSKALYHTFVKLYECGRIVRGEDLHVRLRGEEHNLCWAIRTQPLVGGLDASALVRKANGMLAQLKSDKASLATPLRPPPDLDDLHAWMLSVRLRCLARDGGGASGVAPVPRALAPPPLSRDASASSTTTSAASMEAVGAAASERVREALRELERSEGVTVLWAVERSSRAFGTNRADSDLDVLAVFRLSAESLLSLRPPRKSLVLSLDSGRAAADNADANAEEAEAESVETGGVAATKEPPITIHAHELRHACTLLASANPTMFEALSSSIVYRDHPALSEARALLEETCDRASLRLTYRKMARADFAKYCLQRGSGPKGSVRRVPGKKYAHVLRALLTAEWLGRSLLAGVPAAGPPEGLDQIGLRYVAKPSSAKTGERYFGGDKTSEGQHFTAFYERLLAPYRARRNLHFLEVGVYFGKSLAMFCDYFDDGSEAGSCTVHGVDINLRRYRAHKPELAALGAFRRNSVVVHEYDTTSAAFAAFVQDELPSLDLVLDDGCHTAASQWQCFSLLFPKLTAGGLYIIEDIEKPKAFFGRDGSSAGLCGGGFGALLMAVANENALADSDETHRERELWVQREEAKVVAARERLAKSLEGLRASAARASGDGAVETKRAEALAAREKELAEMDAALSSERSKARGAARAAFDEHSALIRRLYGDIASVEVRRMNVVFAKK